MIFKIKVDRSGTDNGLPVMVWVHGGGFNVGASDDYRPEYFMDEDVVLVIVNYRLGNFGESCINLMVLMF